MEKLICRPSDARGTCSVRVFINKSLHYVLGLENVDLSRCDYLRHVEVNFQGGLMVYKIVDCCMRDFHLDVNACGFGYEGSEKLQGHLELYGAPYAGKI